MRARGRGWSRSTRRTAISATCSGGGNLIGFLYAWKSYRVMSQDTGANNKNPNCKASIHVLVIPEGCQR